MSNVETSANECSANVCEMDNVKCEYIYKYKCFHDKFKLDLT